MTKCPVCHGNTDFYKWPATDDPEKMDVLEYPLYQRSYPGSPGYISPRCEKCFDKKNKRILRLESEKNSGEKFQKTVPAVPAGVCSLEVEQPAHNRKIVGSNPTGPTNAHKCKNCFAPLGADPELTDFGRLTELVIGSCATCITTVENAVEKQFNAEPDYENAVLVSGYNIGVRYPQVWLIPHKKRPGRPSFWKKILRR